MPEISQLLYIGPLQSCVVFSVSKCLKPLYRTTKDTSIQVKKGTLQAVGYSVNTSPSSAKIYNMTFSKESNSNHLNTATYDFG